MQSTILATQNPVTRRHLPTWPPAAFRARALELMTTHHLGWWACRAATWQEDATRLTWVEVTVPSATVTTAAYRVRYDSARDTASWVCIAAQRGQPCFHAGVAIAYGREFAATHHLPR